MSGFVVAGVIGAGAVATGALRLWSKKRKKQ